MKTASPVLALALSLLCLCAAVPAEAQQRTDFGAPSFQQLVPTLTDPETNRLLQLLESRLAPAAGSTSAPADASAILIAFARRLQAGRLTAAQERLVVARLDAIASRLPELTAAVAGTKAVVTHFTVGKSAPDIVGRDLDGQAMRLADYRGRVVVVSFSGEWCGICRSEYPYQRFLLDMYKEWPFALLSVESGRDPQVTKQLKGAQGLTYPSWWDAGAKLKGGPIAESWQVTGWPTTYVLDADGVIRFVDVRREDLLKAVRQLLDENLDAGRR